MIDNKELVIGHMLQTLSGLESALREAGSIQFQCYHNERDKAIAREFIRMADIAKQSIDFASLVDI